MADTVEMTILERGQKAVENFIPIPYSEVDKELREATRQTGEEIKKGLKRRIADMESRYA